MKEKGLLQTGKSFSGAGWNRTLSDPACPVLLPGREQGRWCSASHCAFWKKVSAANHFGKPHTKDDFSGLPRRCVSGQIWEECLRKAVLPSSGSHLTATSAARSCPVQCVPFFQPQVMIWPSSRNSSDPFFPCTRHLPPFWGEEGTSVCFLAPLRLSWNGVCSGHLSYHRLHPLGVTGQTRSCLCALSLHLLFGMWMYLSASFLPFLLLPCSPLIQDVRTTGLKNQVLYRAVIFAAKVGAKKIWKKRKKGNIFLVT